MNFLYWLLAILGALGGGLSLGSSGGGSSGNQDIITSSSEVSYAILLIIPLMILIIKSTLQLHLQIPIMETPLTLLMV
ncbi:MAG: hypothetical protein DRP68_05625 [Candidatus Omnitrophota bacterium]|nr:MAG: hypothetical protein DRP68_05625 [Candidatus Omnitrophota bacterium]